MRGNLPAWRSFEAGMEDGEDIRQLETALRDLGYFDYEPDDHFSWATTSAILKWQKDLDLPRTGTLPLGGSVFTPGTCAWGRSPPGVGDRIAADTGALRRHLHHPGGRRQHQALRSEARRRRPPP